VFRLGERRRSVATPHISPYFHSCLNYDMVALEYFLPIIRILEYSDTGFRYIYRIDRNISTSGRKYDQSEDIMRRV